MYKFPIKSTDTAVATVAMQSTDAEASTWNAESGYDKSKGEKAKKKDDAAECICSRTSLRSNSAMSYADRRKEIKYASAS
ncbi:hypothetical protein LOAG_04152 [Loa loa]|uniref:Uncharacterized protein n=1 Tax=Loa loa TaxID=7209 RepID=A0A1S0U4N9_LOALO|nr:hypothetical protein LOAG_04152 [Loa loa]EFO24337.1 hypothetical protein LOAG_04152 [Loa loa]